MWQRAFRVYECSHSAEVRRAGGQVLSQYRVNMYTALAPTRNINIEASLLLLKNKKHGEEILSI